MQVPEGVEFNCGNCGWMQIVEPPPEKKKDYPVDRGYCTFEPPKVFPMPQAQGKLADVQGRTPMGMVPLMMRPVVDAPEPACGRYTPNTELLRILEEAQPKGCDGSTCEREGCRCGAK